MLFWKRIVFIVSISLISTLVLSSCLRDNPIRKKLANPNSSYYQGAHAFAAKLDGNKRAEAFYKNKNNAGKKYLYDEAVAKSESKTEQKRLMTQYKKHMEELRRKKEKATRSSQKNSSSSSLGGFLTGGLVALGTLGHAVGAAAKSGKFDNVPPQDIKLYECKKRCNSSFSKTRPQCLKLRDSKKGAISAGLFGPIDQTNCLNRNRAKKNQCLKSCR